MLDYIWFFIILISIVCSGITKRIDLLSNSILEGAAAAIGLVISTLGAMAFWSGLMRIAENSGLTEVIAKIFNPILKFLFPDHVQDKQVLHPICMNIVANMLGLGNAATPYGLQAMHEMQKLNKHKNIATNGMVMLLIINTACLQIIPTFLTVLRKNYGAKNPFDILPLLWVTTITALLTGVLCTKMTLKLGKNVINTKKRK
ncbi:MAG: spore maturation protein A [Candidatus Improbicoccus devescovinae]|nr:MAG: spore maturation protein A [Candidatus Improbicoccus devescovinae]